ncbi:MAG: exo-alpha-sialidase [Verrucomicrobia bacterium]|nr:exo-alpha-sialidase [Verrucomicrobiota bacterium]
MKPTRRDFLRRGAVSSLLFAASGGAVLRAADPAPAPPARGPKPGPTFPSMVEADGRLRLDFTEERLILEGGLQPSMVFLRSGDIVVQAQVPEPPFPSERMHYFSAMGTVVSRDGGKTWTRLPLRPGDNGVNLEGGITQLRDGTIVALDTYIVPRENPEVGIGHLYVSRDDWRTVEGPLEAVFALPGADYPSSDDGGRPHRAQRLHRRILELPGGDLLTTYYGWLKGDRTPSTYEPRMIKTRAMLARSSDRGRNWRYVSTIAVDPTVGTEGFGEPVLVRVNHGPRAGRLICQLRTGRELYEAISDDDGKSWSPARPRVYAGLDVNRTELWVDMFRHRRGKKGPLDESNPEELRGAVVDPDLIALRSGLLVAAFGVRVTQKACWAEPRHPWNGNYLAFSRDHGETWPNVVRLTSGVLTTHYMAIEETPKDNRIFVTYDLGGWSRGMHRSVYGRFLDITVKPS